jgi:exonuclease VII large subunit
LDGIGQDLERQGRLAHSLADGGISRQKAEIVGAGQTLDATRRTHRQSIDVAAAQLNSTRSRTGSKLADLLAAVDRRVHEIESGVMSSTSRRRGTLAADCARLMPAAERTLDRDHDRFDAVLAVLAAKDFRRNGWTIATDERGEPMRSIAQLAVGQELTLHLADGSARVATTQTKEAVDG